MESTITTNTENVVITDFSKLSNKEENNDEIIGGSGAVGETGVSSGSGTGSGTAVSSGSASSSNSSSDGSLGISINMGSAPGNHILSGEGGDDNLTGGSGAVSYTHLTLPTTEAV
mgnify:CR=1 FL=1